MLFGAVFLGLAGGIAGGPRLLGGYSRRRLFGISVTIGGTALALVAISPNLVLSLLITAVLTANCGKSSAPLAPSVRCTWCAPVPWRCLSVNGTPRSRSV